MKIQKSLILIINIGIITCCVHAQAKKLSEVAAIKLAQEFVIRNGYTDKPVTDKSKVSLESVEISKNIDEILAFRKDTIIGRAYGILLNEGKTGWIVVFKYKKQNKQVGRAITMGLYGNNLRMEHQDFMLSYVKKPQSYK